MVALLTAVIPAALAIVPLVITSSRRRRLRLIRDESETLALVTDDVAREALRDGLRANAAAYRAHALGLDKGDRALRQFLWSIPAVYVAVVLVVTVAGPYWDQDIGSIKPILGLPGGLVVVTVVSVGAAVVIAALVLEVRWLWLRPGDDERAAPSSRRRWSPKAWKTEAVEQKPEATTKD